MINGEALPVRAQPALPWWRAWQTTIQRQLIFGIALVHAVLMTIFVFDLTDRERAFLHEQSIQQAQGLARTLAANSSPWLLTNDVIGLAEIIQSQTNYPGLRYAMVLSPQGQVLGHNEGQYVGKYVVDEPSLSLLDADGDTAVRSLWQSAELIDIAAPVLVNGKRIGWARVGVSQTTIRENLRVVTRNGLLYTLVAILVGVLFAYFMARGLTHGLHALMTVAERVRKGERDIRANIARADELSTLGQGFNAMLDAVRASEIALNQAYHNEQNSRAAAEQAREELARLNNELEDRVARRTEELAQANAEISQLNTRLRAENLRMSTELDITRRLQQMILPREEELKQIEDLDIAGFMEPASEVAGDYYDVLRGQDGGVKIGIGDITGHGLESGVLMLMVQTAVRTLLAHGVNDPKLFMSALNRTIYDNTQRMRLEKNLTLSFLDYRDGKISVSGQHEEVLVLRAGGRVERIDTVDLGFMVGLEPDIAQFVNHSELQLQPGDAVVLYTDGITESRNRDKQAYGVERLCEVLGRHWDQSAEQIQQAVIRDVLLHIGEHKAHDDLTLVVIKPRRHAS